MSYQQIIIQGNCTRDAEVRQVGQSQVAKIGVAVSEKFRNKEGAIQESTEFFDVEIWDKAGVYPYLTKGQSVLIVGQQKTDKWQDQQAPAASTGPARPSAGSRPTLQPARTSSAVSATRAPAVRATGTAAAVRTAGRICAAVRRRRAQR